MLPASAPAGRDSSEALGWDFSHSGEMGLTLYPELIPCFLFFNQERQMSTSRVDSSLPSALATSFIMGGIAFHG